MHCGKWMRGIISHERECAGQQSVSRIPQYYGAGPGNGHVSHRRGRETCCCLHKRWTPELRSIAECCSWNFLKNGLDFGGYSCIWGRGSIFLFFFSFRKREEKWIKQQKTGRSLSDTYFSNCPLLTRSTYADVSCWPQQCDVGAWRWTVGFVVLGSIDPLTHTPSLQVYGWRRQKRKTIVVTVIWMGIIRCFAQGDMEILCQKWKR